jgi:hypothetical protein
VPTSPSLLRLDEREPFAASCWNELKSAAIHMGIAETPECAAPWEVVVAQITAVAMMGEVFSLPEYDKWLTGYG